PASDSDPPAAAKRVTRRLRHSYRADAVLCGNRRWCAMNDRIGEALQYSPERHRALNTCIERPPSLSLFGHDGLVPIAERQLDLAEEVAARAVALRAKPESDAAPADVDDRGVAATKVHDD